jgi:hypothetical protein
MAHERDTDRRRFLQFVGGAAAATLAGCSSDSGDTETPASVPEAYRTATSIGGQERDPDGLSTKEALDYQEEPKDGQQCSGCTFYVEDKNGDGKGACTLVEGTIAPDAWCASYTAHEE